MIGVSCSEPFKPKSQRPRLGREVPSQLTLLLGLWSPTLHPLPEPRLAHCAGSSGLGPATQEFTSEDLPFYTFYLICIFSASSLPRQPLRGGGSPSWKGRDYSLLGEGWCPLSQALLMGEKGASTTEQGHRPRGYVRLRPLGCPVALGPMSHQEGEEQRSLREQGGRSPEGVCVADRGGCGLWGAGVEPRGYRIEVGP